MDAKENQLIDYYHQRVVSNIFDETDIYMILILLRRHASKRSPVYEFSNFVAHREKDRGLIHEYILDKKRFFERDIKGESRLVVNPVYSLTEVEKSFNGLLKDIYKPLFSSQTVQDIVFCIIILLQNVQLVNKKGKYIGTLTVGINRHEISLMGTILISQMKINFPVLEIPNNYTKVFDHVIDEMAMVKVVVKARRSEDNLEVEFLPDRTIQSDVNPYKDI